MILLWEGTLLGDDGERSFPEKPWKKVTGETEQPSAFGGILVGSSQVESRHITGHRLRSPICSYLQSREMLVELSESFAVVGENLPHMWKYCISFKTMLFWYGVLFVLFCFLFCILPWMQKQPQEQSL